MKQFLNTYPKLKNPYFYLSVFALIFSASGIDFQTLTSWQLLGQSLMSILKNPVAIIAVITATTHTGLFNIPSKACPNKSQDVN